MKDTVTTVLSNAEFGAASLPALPSGAYEAKLAAYVVISAVALLAIRWMIRVSSEIRGICNELTQIHLVFKSRENDLTAGRVWEILEATVELKMTKNFWEKFLLALLPRANQSPNTKIQSTIKINDLMSPKSLMHDTVGFGPISRMPIISASILFGSILLVNMMESIMLGLYPSAYSSSTLMSDRATSLLIAASAIFALIQGGFIAGVFKKLSDESAGMRRLLEKHIEFQSEMHRLSQLQRDISRLTVQVSLVESTMLSMAQVSSMRDSSTKTSSGQSRALATLPAATNHVINKQNALDIAASSVRDVVMLIDSACDTISLDIESTYRKLFSKYGNSENRDASQSPVAVLSGTIETKPKLINVARDNWGEWNVCKRSKPAFDEAVTFLDSAENCVITLTNLKNSIVELGMDHADRQSGAPNDSKLKSVTNNYILMGDVLTEIRNAIGKISTHNHEVTESWRSFQNQVENLNKVQKERLFAARGIVSNCFKTVSTQMNQIQVDLNNHLRNISSTIGMQ